MKVILFVEDNMQNAVAMQRWAMRKFGINMLHTNTQATALRCLREGSKFLGMDVEIVAVVTDWEFPIRIGESPSTKAGADVVKVAREQGLPFCVVSGLDAPIAGYEPWYTRGDTQGLTTFLQEVKTRMR